MGAQQGKDRGSHSGGGGGGGGAPVSCIGLSSSSSPVASVSPHCISLSGSGSAPLGGGSTLRGSRIKSSSAGHSSNSGGGGGGSSSGGGGAAGGSGGLSQRSGGHKDARCNPSVGLNIFTEHNGKFSFFLRFAPACRDTQKIHTNLHSFPCRWFFFFLSKRT